MKNLTGILFTIIFFIALNSYSQQKYKIVSRQFVTGNAGSIHLNDASGAGIAWINGKLFTHGTIEFDAKGQDKFQASFVGFAFHGVNDSTYECVYFRPFNFRATDPGRKGHAVQYIALPKYDWPTLRAQFPGKYEQPLSPAPNPDEWFHVRIEVSDQFITVYVNNSVEPALKIMPLIAFKGKMVGYWVGNGSAGDWRNLHIVSMR